MTRGFVDTGRFDPVFAVEMDATPPRPTRRTSATTSHATPTGRTRDRGRRDVPGAPTSSSAARRARASRRSTATASGSSGGRCGANTSARSREPRRTRSSWRTSPNCCARPSTQAFKKAAEDGARVQRRGTHPQRRRLRRAPAPPARDRHRRPRRRDPVARRRRTAIPATTSSSDRPVADIPRRRARPAAQADRQGLAQRPQPAARDDRPLPARPARRRQPLPDAGQPRRRWARAPRPACWRNKPTGTTDVFGRLCWDRRPSRSDGVLQAREGSLPAPERGPADHDPRGRALHELPGRLRVPGRQKWTEIAKQIGNAVPPLLAQAIARTARATTWTHRFTGRQSQAA